MYGQPLPSNRGPMGTIQIRVLIPKVASGVLIGRQGSVIKQMSEMSNCKIQLGEETDPFDTKERIVIINSAAVPSVVLVRIFFLLQYLNFFKNIICMF